MSAATFFTPLPTNTLVLASQFTTFQDYFNLYVYFGCWNFDLFKTKYHRKKPTPFYDINALLSRLQIIPNRGFHKLQSFTVMAFERIKFKAQQKHMISCAMHPDTPVMNNVYREVLLNTAAKLLFFQHEFSTGSTASMF